MTAPTFTILLPVHRQPDLMAFAVASVMAQARQDFELFIICDGAPEETVKAAKALAKKDRRVKVFAHDKGERNGELYRHQALKQAKGKYVAQIGDDDLWLSHHLAALETLLEDCDFGHTIHCYIDTDGKFGVHLNDLSDLATQQRMLSMHVNYFGPTYSGYHLEAYQKLPEGWGPAPDNIWSDLWMWRKFLRQDHLRFATHYDVTALGFQTHIRQEHTLAERRAEMKRIWEKMAHADFRASLWPDILAQLSSENAENLSELRYLQIQNDSLKNMQADSVSE